VSNVAEVINPLTNNPLPEVKAEQVGKLRTIRSNARKDARSGHPGRRASGLRARAMAAFEIRKIYVQAVNA
jgi:hypothetical protein